MSLEIRHLKLVSAIAEQGSVTKAGHRLHLTQSALSHQLRDIEQRLGVGLFQRLGKKMVLTSAGERLLQSARVVLEELKSAEEEIQQTAAGRGGVLRISTECYTCYHWLPSQLKVFHSAYPKVEVRIVVEATRRPVPALLEGIIDLAIVGDLVRNHKVRYRPLFKDELMAVMEPGHPFASRPYLLAEDFVDQHLILYSGPKEDFDIFKRVFFPAGVSPQRVTHIEVTEAIVEMVKAGLGIGVMATWAAAPYIAAGEMRAVRVTKTGLERTWQAATLRTPAEPPYQLEFIKLLLKNAGPGLKNIARAPRARSRK